MALGIFVLLAGNCLARGSQPAANEYTTERYIGRLGQVIRNQSPIFAQPGRRRYYTCSAGQYVVLTRVANGWYGVLMADMRTVGWISASRVRLLPYNVVTQSPSFQALVATEEGRRIAAAFRFLGTPYKWGGNGPGGIDCSGFVRAVFAINGEWLPRVSCQQALVGKPVPFNQLRPGDRLYFAMKGKGIDHTGMYIGGGQFIHASSNRGCVAVDSLLVPKYARALVAARR
ncbi:MAG: C40 family peptidase [Armatimonadota bacterium]